MGVRFTISQDAQTESWKGRKSANFVITPRERFVVTTWDAVLLLGCVTPRTVAYDLLIYRLP